MDNCAQRSRNSSLSSSRSLSVNSNYSENKNYLENILFRSSAAEKNDILLFDKESPSKFNITNEESIDLQFERYKIKDIQKASVEEKEELKPLTRNISRHRIYKDNSSKNSFDYINSNYNTSRISSNRLHDSLSYNTNADSNSLGSRKVKISNTLQKSRSSVKLK